MNNAFWKPSGKFTLAASSIVLYGEGKVQFVIQLKLIIIESFSYVSLIYTLMFISGEK